MDTLANTTQDHANKKQAEADAKAAQAAKEKADAEAKATIKIVKDESTPYDATQKTAVPPWPADFPRATTHTSVTAVKTAGLKPGETLNEEKQSPTFVKAKSGDEMAAKEIIEKVVKDDRILDMKIKYPEAIVVPIRAQEATGKNKIPEAYAGYMADNFGFKIDESIRQSNEVRHTGANAKQRFERLPLFQGTVIKGATYILVDDVVTTGSTFSGLRMHIESNGGHVVAATALAADGGPHKPDSRIIGITTETLEKLRKKFYNDIDDLEKILKKYGVDSIGHLTNSQGLYLYKFANVKRIGTAFLAE